MKCDFSCNCDGSCLRDNRNGAKAGAIIVIALLMVVLVCAAAFSAPEDLKAIKQDVDSRINYRFYTGYDAPKNLKTDEGNCVRFADEYRKLARDAGYNARVSYCTVNGTGHLYTIADGWVLDNRHTTVIPVERQTCN